MKILIIAEAGINHNRSLSAAKKLVDIAKACGADVVKFQHEKPPVNGPIYCLTDSEIIEVYNYCVRVGMPFACTAFDVETLRFLLMNTKMEFIKIASCDNRNEPLLTVAENTGMRIIQSLRAGDMALPSTMHRQLLHVVSEYPTPIERSNLRRMVESKFDGLSDHSGNALIPALAVAMGARIIEVHLTLDRAMDGPDHKASLDPIGFAHMVKNVRDAEKAIG